MFNWIINLFRRKKSSIPDVVVTPTDPVWSDVITPPLKFPPREVLRREQVIRRFREGEARRASPYPAILTRRNDDDDDSGPSLLTAIAVDVAVDALFDSGSSSSFDSPSSDDSFSGGGGDFGGGGSSGDW